MDGVRVGKRVIGAEAPVTIGWENIPRVQRRPAQAVHIHLVPARGTLRAGHCSGIMLPISIAKASDRHQASASASGCCFWRSEWVNPRYASWQLTWKECVTDLFYVGLGSTRFLNLA